MKALLCALAVALLLAIPTKAWPLGVTSVRGQVTNLSSATVTLQLQNGRLIQVPRPLFRAPDRLRPGQVATVHLDQRRFSAAYLSGSWANRAPATR